MKGMYGTQASNQPTNQSINQPHLIHVNVPSGNVGKCTGQMEGWIDIRDKTKTTSRPKHFRRGEGGETQQGQENTVENFVL